MSFDRKKTQIWSKVIEKGWISEKQYQEAYQFTEEKEQSLLSYLVVRDWLNEDQADYLYMELQVSQVSDESSKGSNIISGINTVQLPKPQSESKSRSKELQEISTKETLIESSHEIDSKIGTSIRNNEAEEFNKEDTVVIKEESPVQNEEDFLKGFSLPEEKISETVEIRKEEEAEGSPTASEYHSSPSFLEMEINQQAPIKVGDYWIQDELGRGGMGVVYRAYHKRLNQFYAVKLLVDSGLSTKDSIERFHQEAKANAKLQHRNIVQVFNSGAEKSFHYIVMELIEGKPLSQKLIEDPPSIRESLLLIKETLEALNFAHQQGIIHRDIKLENIFLTDEGTIKLADFGLAKDVHLDSKLQRLTHSGMIIGTPAYMSPEQVLGKVNQIDVRSDLYSIGVCLYELLTQQCPFKGNMHGILTKIIKDDPTPPSELAPKIHKDIDVIVMKALEKDKDRRYQDAKEFLKDINLFLQGFPILSRPNSRFEKIQKWVKRHWVLSVLLTFLFLLLAGIGFDKISSRSFNKKLLDQHMELVMTQVGGSLENYLSGPAEANVGFLKSLLEKKIVSSRDTQKLMEFFELILEKYPQFMNVGYGDESGYFVMVSRTKRGVRFKNVVPFGDSFQSFWRDTPSSTPSNNGVEEEIFDCRKRPWYILSKERQGIAWTNPYMFKSSQLPGITCGSVVFLEEPSKPSGVIFIDINLQEMSVFLSKSSSILEGILTFQDGQIFASSKETDWNLKEKKGKLILPNIKEVSEAFLPQKHIKKFLEDPETPRIVPFIKKRQKYLLGVFPMELKNQNWCFWYIIGEGNFLDPPPVDHVTLLLVSSGMLLIFLLYFFGYYHKWRNSSDNLDFEEN